MDGGNYIYLHLNCRRINIKFTGTVKQYALQAFNRQQVRENLFWKTISCDDWRREKLLIDSSIEAHLKALFSLSVHSSWWVCFSLGSDRNSACCNDCHFEVEGKVCQEPIDATCKGNSYCTGLFYYCSADKSVDCTTNVAFLSVYRLPLSQTFGTREHFSVQKHKKKKKTFFFYPKISKGYRLKSSVVQGLGLGLGLGLGVRVRG